MTRATHRPQHCRPEGHSAAMRRFFVDSLGLPLLLMDLGRMQTLGKSQAKCHQPSLASQGGGGTTVPALPIAVDALDSYHARAEHGLPQLPQQVRPGCCKLGRETLLRGFHVRAPAWHAHPHILSHHT